MLLNRVWFTSRFVIILHVNSTYTVCCSLLHCTECTRICLCSPGFEFVAYVAQLLKLTQSHMWMSLYEYGHILDVMCHLCFNMDKFILRSFIESIYKIVSNVFNIRNKDFCCFFYCLHFGYCHVPHWGYCSVNYGWGVMAIFIFWRHYQSLLG